MTRRLPESIAATLAMCDSAVSRVTTLPASGLLARPVQVHLWQFVREAAGLVAVYVTVDS